MRRRHHDGDLSAALDTVAAALASGRVVGLGPVLQALAAATAPTCPGAAAALVDPDSTEVARQRAYGIVHGHVLAAGPALQRVVLDALAPTVRHACAA